MNRQLLLCSRMLYPLLFLFISFASMAQGNSGAIKGKALSSDSISAEYVSIGLKGKSKGTVTDKNGEFMIHNIPAGEYTLIIQVIGFETIEKTVIVSAGETLDVGTIWLQEDIHTLQEIVIEGTVNKFAQKETDYTARMPLSNLENPQVYNTVSKELMQEQVVTNFDDAIKNSPGVNRLWSSTGRGSDGAGYFSMRGFAVQPSMINGIPGISNGSVDPANTERIETIKGPSSTLFGSSLISFGGLINIVTKRPYETRGGEVSYTAGSYDLNRITMDLNTPLNESKTLLFRVNGAYHYEGSFQDAGFKKSTFLAPSLLFKANDRLTFYVNTEFYNSESTNPLMVFLNRSRPLIATTPDELNIDFKKSYTSNDITVKTPTLNLYGQASYKLSDKWVSQTNVGRSVRKTDGYLSYVMFLGPQVDTLLTRNLTDQVSTSTTTDIQQNFVGDFKVGNMRNRMVVGVDFLNQQTNNNSTAYIPFDNLTIKPGYNDPKYSQLTSQALDAKLAVAAGPTKTFANSWTYSAYVSDVLNITDKLLLMASLRFDYFDTKGTRNANTGVVTGVYEQAAFSPKLGIVYQVVKDRVSVFGNYMNGFKNVAPITTPQPPGYPSTFKPQQANQYEGGVKLDMFAHKLTLTTSYYDILVTNMTRTGTPVTVGGQTYPTPTIQDGSQRSKGVEIDLIANPLPGFNIVAGYGYNDSKMVESAVYVEGRRPVSAGPVNLANAWVSYTLLKGSMKGFGLGVGGNHASENIITNDSRTGKFTLPAYTVMNATVFYNAKSYRLAVKVDNLTNKVYYGGWTTVERAMPIRVMGSVAVRF